MSHELVSRKLINFFGPTQARTLMREILGQLGLTKLQSADDRLRFGTILIERGGANEFIGRTIALQARLHGARATV